MKNFVAAILGAFLAITLCFPNALAARTDIQTYDLGGLGDVTTECNLAAHNFGGVCFTVNPGELVVDVVINDAMQPSFQVGAYLVFLDATDAIITQQVFCDQAIGVSIPPATAAIVVWLDGLLFSPIDCGLGNSVTATYGNVQADFTP